MDPNEHKTIIYPPCATLVKQIKDEFDTDHYLRWTASNYNDTCYDLTETLIQKFDRKINKLGKMIMLLSTEQCMIMIRIFSNQNMLKYNQHKQGFATSPKCELCSSLNDSYPETTTEDETILHLLESCPGLSEIRARSFEGETEINIIEILKNESSNILQKLKIIIKFFKESKVLFKEREFEKPISPKRNIKGASIKSLQRNLNR